MPHPRRLTLKILLLILVIITTVLTLKPSSKLTVKASTPCPGQIASSPQIQVQTGLLSLENSNSAGSYYAPAIDPNSNCLIDKSAFIESEFLTYDSLFNTYYNKSSTSQAQVSSADPINLTDGGSKMYWVKNGSNNGIPGTPKTIAATPISGIYVVFVDGDLEIKGNITSDPKSGVMFIVKNNLHIDPSVTNVDAFIVSYGSFCDNWDPISNCTSNNTNAITFNGSIISLGAGSLAFNRASSNVGVPAEVINYQPKYLALLKDIFSKDKNIWTEIK